jgi:hypothetical protein
MKGRKSNWGFDNNIFLKNIKIQKGRPMLNWSSYTSAKYYDLPFVEINLFTM